MMTIEQAMTRIQKMAASNAPFGARINAEKEYALAYDRLVAKGERPKLRAKYRLK